MMSCQALTQLVTDYLEGRLPLRRRLTIRLHLLMCRHCTEYLRQMRRTVETLGALPPEPMSDAVRDELLRVFERSQRQP